MKNAFSTSGISGLRAQYPVVIMTERCLNINFKDLLKTIKVREKSQAAKDLIASLNNQVIQFIEQNLSKDKQTNFQVLALEALFDQGKAEVEFLHNQIENFDLQLIKYFKESGFKM